MPDTDMHVRETSAVRRALAMIRDLEGRLATAERAAHAPVAVVGVGCRFPGGASDPDRFWELLAAGRDGVTEVPADRWDVSAFYDPDPDRPGKTNARWGGFLSDVAAFDAGLFGISRREAEAMDPQHRLLLEVSWRALEHAGLAPDGLTGSRTGVFVGLSTSDYATLMGAGRDASWIDAYASLGNAASIAAGRLAYAYGLQGPAMVVDTACSSSLTAVHLAMQALRAGECGLALAAGVNLTLTPELTINFTKARMLAADGRCKTFDAAADGYVRGEGCGVVVLKLLSAALAAGDRVLAVIRGSAVNQDGRSAGLTAPNGPSQEAVIRAALLNGGVAPDAVDYVEAHGTGTALGDPIEMHALANVFAGRSRELLVGSVKTNIGHTEAAAGIAGLIKAVLMLRRQAVPASLHFERLNPHIGLGDVPIAVPTRLSPRAVRLVGVSSFGFSGTNAHVVLQHADGVVLQHADGVVLQHADGVVLQHAEHSVLQPAEHSVPHPAPRPVRILPLSARDGAALEALAAAWSEALAAPGADLASLCHTAGVGRARFAQRLAVVAADAASAGAALAAAPRATAGRPRVAFLCTGQGSTYAGMAAGLAETAPVFRAVLQRCDAVMGLDRPLAALFGDAAALARTDYAQPALYAVSAGLGALWRSWGIEPVAVLGHSVGEYAAAHLAGVLTLEDGARLIAARGRLMQALPAGGAMAALLGPVEAARAVVARHPAVEIAGENSPTALTVAGPEAAIDRLLADLALPGGTLPGGTLPGGTLPGGTLPRGTLPEGGLPGGAPTGSGSGGGAVLGQKLPLRHAFHSRLLEPMLDELARVADGFAHHAPVVPVVGNLDGSVARHDGAYWRAHARAPVRFAAGLATLAGMGVTHLVELGAQPVLSGFARTIAAGGAAGGSAGAAGGSAGMAALPSLLRARAGQDGRVVGWTALAEALARLWRDGAAVDWAGYDAPYAPRITDAPGYPFQRQRFWFHTKSSSSAAPGSETGLKPSASLVGERIELATGQILHRGHLDTARFPFLADHVVMGETIVPGASHIVSMLAAAGAELRDVVFAMPLKLAENGCDTQILQHGERLELHASGPEGWTLHASAIVPDVPPRSETRSDLGQSGAAAMDPGLSGSAAAPTPFPFASSRAQGQAPTPETHDQAQTPHDPAQASHHPRQAPHDPAQASHHQRQTPHDPAQAPHDQRQTPHDPAQAPHDQRQTPHDQAPHQSFAGTPVDQTAIAARCTEDPDGPAALHAMLASRGISLGPAFKGIRRLFRGSGEALVQVALPDDVRPLSPLHPAQLDACFQALGATFAGAGAGGAFLPLAVDRVVLHRPWSGPLWAHVQAHGSGGASAEVATGDVTLFDDAGDLVAEVTGLTIKRVDAQAADQSARWTYRVEWRPLDAQPLSLPAPGELATAVLAARDAAAPVAEPGLAQGLEQLAAAYAAQARASVLEAAVVPGQRRLFAHLPIMAGGETAQPEPLAAALLARHGERLEITLARRSGRALADVLRGQADPLAVLFGQDDGASVYADPPFARMLNAMVVAAIRGAAETLPPGRKLRVLEIGAGTGAVFAALQDVLPPERLAFTFTDVSPAFLHAATAGFGDRLAGCAPLDIERPPEAQGFAPASFDLVLAANVLHATADLRTSLRHATRLVAPGGVLLLLEAVRRSAWSDLVFGLTPGWWRFTDGALRPDHPLIPVAKWHDLLAACFAQVVPVRSPGEGEQMLAIARAPLPERETLVWEAPHGAEVLDLTAAALDMVQRVLARPNPPALRLVTRAAQPVGGRTSPAVAAVLGLGRVIGIEHPELDCQLLDLPADAPIGVANAAPGDAREAAWRHGQWHVPTLTRAALPSDPAFTCSGTHLITGGLGGLGPLLASWLIEHGAGKVVLMARRPRPDVALPPAAVVEIGDVTRLEDVRRLAGPDVRGVFHLAGALSDAALLRLTREDLARVFAAKVDGARNLDTAFADRTLDAFVLFGSSAGLIGNPGQGAHAAANAWLAGLAHDRQQRGLAGLCIDWGAWGEAGTLTRSDVGERLVATGASLMAPPDALRALGRAIVSREPRLFIAAIDWPRFLAGYGDVPPAFFSAVAPVRRPATQAARTSGGEPAASREALAAFVAECAAMVLRAAPGETPAPDIPLNEAGLDSLMALELRRALGDGLGLQLPATLLFNFPTIEALTEHLGSMLGLGVGPGEQRPAAPEPPPVIERDAIVETVMRMSEAEMEALIAQEFALTVAGNG